MIDNVPEEIVGAVILLVILLLLGLTVLVAFVTCP